MLAAAVIVPVEEIKPAVNKLPPVILPVTVSYPATIVLAAVAMLPVAVIAPAVTKLPPFTLPATVNKFAVLSNVKPALAPRMSPVSANCTQVFEPAASMLPLMSAKIVLA